MTANFIAKVVQSLYDKMDLDEIRKEFNGIEKYSSCGRLSDEWVNKRIENKTYIRWLKACSLLEIFCRMNMGNFEETELVYRWAKDECEEQNKILNERRLYIK